MSPENLSRRAILAGAASVPALALPAVVATAIPAVATAAPTSLTAAPDPVIALAERAMQLYEYLRGDQCSRKSID
jgi:predicted lipoprotein with Yx(FWY)xxD motif